MTVCLYLPDGRGVHVQAAAHRGHRVHDAGPALRGARAVRGAPVTYDGAVRPPTRGWRTPDLRFAGIRTSRAPPISAYGSRPTVCGEA
jgi:hypothetical protein